MSDQAATTDRALPRVLMLAGVGAAMLAGAVLVLLSAPHGLSTSPDSMHYLSVPRHVLAGEGVTHFNGNPVVLWAPLYPLLLAPVYAFGDLIGTEPHMLLLMRVANALLFAAVIGVSARLFARCIRSRALVVIATAAVIIAYPLIFVASFLWTELPFVLLVLVFMLVLLRFLEQPGRGAFAILVVLAALSALLRYPGVVVIGVGGLAILAWMPGQRLLARVRWAAGFGVGASVPLLAVLARNHHLTGTLMGTRPGPGRPLRTNLNHTYEVVRAWFLPESVEIGYYRAGAVLLVLAAVGIAWVVRRHGRAAPRAIVGALPLPVVLWVVVYPATFIVSETLYDLTPIDDRYLAPVYVFVILLVFMLLDALVQWARESGSGPRRAFAGALIALAALWLVIPALRLEDDITTLRATSRATADTYGYWRGADLVRDLAAGPVADRPRADVLTNVPMHLLVHTGIPAAFVPRTLAGWDAVAARLARSGGEGVLLIWFADVERCDFTRDYCIETAYTPAQLGDAFALETLRTAAGGAVYRVTLAGGSAE